MPSANSVTEFYNRVEGKLRNGEVNAAMRLLETVDSGSFILLSCHVDEDMWETPLHRMAALACEITHAMQPLEFMLQKTCRGRRCLEVRDSLGANCLNSIMMLSHEIVNVWLVIQVMRMLTSCMPQEKLLERYDGETALHLAVQYRDEPLVEQLVQVLPPEAKTMRDERSRRTPKEWAIESGASQRIVDLVS